MSTKFFSTPIILPIIVALFSLLIANGGLSAINNEAVEDGIIYAIGLGAIVAVISGIILIFKAKQKRPLALSILISGFMAATGTWFAWALSFAQYYRF